MDCTEECVHLVIDTEGNVVNIVVTGPETPDDWSPGPGLTLLPHSQQGAIGGTYINGVYTAPPEPEEEPDEEE